jgi:hypothetical protein
MSLPAPGFLPQEKRRRPDGNRRPSGRHSRGTEREMSDEQSRSYAIDVSATDATRRRALLREVNDQMLAIAQRWQLWDCRIEFHCECGRASCHEMAALLPLEYSHARRSADAFLLAPRHQGTNDEVIEQLGEHAVVACACCTTASDRSGYRRSDGRVD